MADKKDEKKDDKPKMDYESISKKLREHAEGDHIDDLNERLSEAFSKYKKSIGNKRKFNADEAETLAHQLYDEMSTHISEYYGIKPEEHKSLKGKKGKHGDSVLDALVEKHFNLERNDFIKDLKKYSESGKSFSNRYITQQLQQNIQQYNTNLQRKIVAPLGEENIDELKTQIQKYADKHKIDPRDYKTALKKNASFNEVLGTYASLASSYYLPEEKKPDGKK